MKRCVKRGVLVLIAVLLMLLSVFNASADEGVPSTPGIPGSPGGPGGPGSPAIPGVPDGGGSGSAPATPAIRALVSFSAKDIKMERIGVADDDRVINVRVKSNHGKSRVKISAVIPELGVIATRGPFLVGAGDRTSRMLVLEDMPSYASGEYTVRIVAKDKTRRVKHRTIII